MSTATTQIIISGKDQLSGVVADAGRRMGTEMEGMRRQVLTVNTALAGFAGYFTGGALAAGGSELLRVAASFEKMEVSLRTITGSAAAAEHAMSWITDFTATTPFQLEEVANGFRKLTAYGMDAVEVMPLLGDTAAAMGKSLDQAVEMFADAATGEFERLKEFGVRAKQEGDKVTFSWQENGQQMVVTSAKTQQGITNALGGVFDRFEGSMIAQSKTWEGMTSNMADQWTLWKKEVMDSGPFEFLKESMFDFTATFQAETGKMQLKEWAHGTSEAILSTFETASYAVEALAFPINGIKGAFNALKLGIVEIEELALDMYMGLYDFLPSSVSLTSNQIRAMRETIAQTRAEATAGMDAVGENTKFINNMFSELRQNIDKARTESAKVAPGAPVNVPGVPPAASSGGTSSVASAKESKAREKAYEKMLADGKKAAEALDQYWNDYEDGRVKAVADGVAARETANAKDLALVTEFADKYKELILGETDFKLVQIDAQGAAYRKAGADEIAVAQWVAQAKLAESRAWQDGVKRGLLDYADSATDAAQLAQDAITGGFKGMEDSLVEFVKTGKLSFSELADSIISDMMRIMIQQSITGPLASGMSSAISGWLNPQTSTAAGSASGGFNYAGEMSSYFATHHAGGIAGAEPTSMRLLNPSMFANAPRLHTGGIAGDEVPIIAKRGEGVFTQGQMKALGGGSTSVVINNYSGAKAEAKETTDSRGNRRVEVVIGEMVAGEIQRQGSAANNSMRNSFGLRPTMARR